MGRKFAVEVEDQSGSKLSPNLVYLFVFKAVHLLAGVLRRRQTQWIKVKFQLFKINIQSSPLPSCGAWKSALSNPWALKMLEPRFISCGNFQRKKLQCFNHSTYFNIETKLLKHMFITITIMTIRQNGVIFESRNCQLHGEFTFPPSFTQHGVTNIFEVPSPW